MYTRIAGGILGGVVVGALAGALVGACSDQPRVRCAAARGNFAATYHLVSGSGECAMRKGDVLAVQTYNGANADRSPNWDDASMAIQPNAVSGLLAVAEGAMIGDENPANKPYALGHFSTAEPGDDGFCAAPDLAPARVQLPAVPDAVDAMGAPMPGQPAADIEYRWSNVRVYVTAAAAGTMFTADLTLREGACTAVYTVDALYPAVSCLQPPPEPEPEPPVDADASLDAATMSAAEDAGDASLADPDSAAVAPPPAAAEPMLDESLCSPVANLAKGRPLGSGINPDVATRCDPDLQLCVLAKPPPALR